MTTPPDHRRTLTALVVVLVALATAVAPVAGQDDAEPAFVVEVHADGSAAVSVRSTFDLTTEAEREAFQSLVDDERVQQDAAGRFLDRLRPVASGAANATGREMAVTDATVDLRRTADGETGVVTLSVTWAGLAAVEGDRLVVTEPFASGFAPDRPFVLRAPDGYEVTSAAPEPAATARAEATWTAGADLSGFAVEMQPTATDDAARSGGQPGFGVTTAVLAGIVGVLTAAARRRFT